MYIHWSSNIICTFLSFAFGSPAWCLIKVVITLNIWTMAYLSVYMLRCFAFWESISSRGKRIVVKSSHTEEILLVTVREREREREKKNETSHPFKVPEPILSITRFGSFYHQLECFFSCLFFLHIKNRRISQQNTKSLSIILCVSWLGCPIHVHLVSFYQIEQGKEDNNNS